MLSCSDVFTTSKSAIATQMKKKQSSEIMFSSREENEDSYKKLFVIKDNNILIRTVEGAKFNYSIPKNGCYNLKCGAYICVNDGKILSIDGKYPVITDGEKIANIKYKDEFFTEKNFDCDKLKFDVINHIFVQHKSIKGFRTQLYLPNYFNVVKMIIYWSEDSNDSDHGNENINNNTSINDNDLSKNKKDVGVNEFNDNFVGNREKKSNMINKNTKNITIIKDGVVNTKANDDDCKTHEGCVGNINNNRANSNNNVDNDDNTKNEQRIASDIAMVSDVNKDIKHGKLRAFILSDKNDIGCAPFELYEIYKLPNDNDVANIKNKKTKKKIVAKTKKELSKKILEESYKKMLLKGYLYLRPFDKIDCFNNIVLIIKGTKIDYINAMAMDLKWQILTKQLLLQNNVI